MNILSLGGQALKLGTALLQMGGGGGGGSGTSTLGTVPGTLHWFDATVPSAVLSPSGTPLTQWAGASVGSLKNQIAGGAAMSSVGVGGSYTVSPPALAGGARARVNKGFAACGPAELASGRPYTLWPTLDNNHKWALPGVNLSAASAWWIAIAYTRPNMQQIQSSQTASSGTLSYLLAFNVLGLLAIDNITRSTVAGADIGTLSVLGTSVRTNAAPRHYSTVLLQNVPGTGISVYLDGNATAAATGISAASLGTTTQILYAMGVPGSYSSTSAQCYLHEFALGGALTAPQRAAVLASLGRYPVGVADVALFSDAGQSNLGFVPASAFDAMRRLVAYFGGFVAVDFFANEGQAPGRAMGYSNTSYLADPGDGSDPSTWAYGSVGANNQSARNNAVVHLPYDQAGFAAIFTYYSEADSGQDYSYKTRMKAIWKRYAALVRAGMPVPGSASTIPLCATRLIANQTAASGSLGGGGGAQMFSDGLDELAADPTAGFAVVVNSTADGSSRGLYGTTYPPGGDSIHLNDSEHILAFTRAGARIARVLKAAGRGDTSTTLPAGASGVRNAGPAVTAAHYEGTVYYPTGSVLATITHDTGTDLVVNTYAADGRGWSVRDGWVGPANATRGSSIVGTLCARVSATTLRIRLASVPANAGSMIANARFFYCENPTLLGDGCAVYDNCNLIAASAGFDVASDVGPAYAVTMPLGMTLAGVAFT